MSAPTHALRRRELVVFGVVPRRADDIDGRTDQTGPGALDAPLHQPPARRKVFFHVGA